MKYRIIFFAFMLVPFIHYGQTHSLLQNIGNGSDHGILIENQATSWNGKSYFISYNTDHYVNMIWSTDGTSANTLPVDNSRYPEIQFLTSVDNYLIFNAWAGDHRTIMRSDGTPSGFEMIMEFPMQRIVFMQELNSSTVVFITENYENDSTYAVSYTHLDKGSKVR